MYVQCRGCKYYYQKDDHGKGGICTNHLSTQFAVFIRYEFSNCFGCPCPEEEE